MAFVYLKEVHKIYPLIRTKIKFDPFIQNEPYPITILDFEQEFR